MNETQQDSAPQEAPQKPQASITLTRIANKGYIEQRELTIFLIRPR